MGFQDTINEIFKGLTGDNKADIQYLKEQMEQHKDDENSTEMLLFRHLLLPIFAPSTVAPKKTTSTGNMKIILDVLNSQLLPQ